MSALETKYSTFLGTFIFTKGVFAQTPVRQHLRKPADMDNLTTISWIFLAIALASDKSPVDFKEISKVADGINHAVPIHKELQDSVSWLLKKSLILKNNNKYSLSDIGLKVLIGSTSKTNIIMDIWKDIELHINKMND